MIILITSIIIQTIISITFVSIFESPFFTIFLFWLFLLCQHVKANHFCVKNLQSFYNQYSADFERTKYAWFIRARKMKANRLIKLHKRKEARQAKKKKKKEKKIFMIKKRAEDFTCRRCLSHFDNNSKLHRHV